MTEEAVAGGQLSSMTSRGYDKLGRVTSTTNQSDLVKTYEYSANGRTTTVTLPGGATLITENYADGRIKQRSGTGQIQQSYSYWVNSSDGSRWTRVYSGAGGFSSPRWRKTVTDMAGRTIRVEKPAYDNGSGSVSEIVEYNDKGQMQTRYTVYESFQTGTQPEPIGVPTIYRYDDFGRLEVTCLDLGDNGEIDFHDDGESEIPDRIEETEYKIEQDDAWWEETRRYVYADPSSDERTLVSTVRQTLVGAGCACRAEETVWIDIHGNETRTTVDIDAEDKEVVHTTTITYAGAAGTVTAEKVFANGLLVQETAAHGGVTTYTYDALGRRIGVSVASDGGSRTTGQTIHYNADGRIDWIRDAADGVVFYQYHPDTGARTTVITSLVEDPSSNPSIPGDDDDKLETHTKYDLHNRVIGTWGADYPVVYEYDGYGRMVKMHTLRDKNGQISINSYSDMDNNLGSFDTTIWEYHARTGLLTAKEYADGKGPSYTYWPDGKLKQRTWTRDLGGSVNPTTDYAYTDAGELESIDYEPDSADNPDVAFTYDRLGRRQTVTDAMGTRTFAYDEDTLLLTDETYGGAGDIPAVHIRRTHDAGRPGSLALLDDQSQIDYLVTYGYDEDNGHLDTVTYGESPNQRQFAYDYVPQSHLPAGWHVALNGQNTLHVTRAYENNRDLVDAVQNKINATTVSLYDYTNDPAGRRIARDDSGTAFGSPNPPESNAFTYNPRSELVKADMDAGLFEFAFDKIGNRITRHLDSSLLTSYDANSLNQYTTITPAGAQAQSPAHDDDGNLTDDGDAWTYAWNGENRLVAAESATTRIENTYDYQGRRVRRKTFTGSPENWTPSEHLVYIYDEWNMIRELELDTMNNPSTLRNHVWGLDLSGTLQGAGGVGGLLATEDTSGIYCTTFDANGNVSEYVTTAGATAAHYEYDPFGNTSTATGAKAGDFPYRFSTKYLDSTAGLYYYGYRFCSPDLGRWLSRDPLGEFAERNLYLAFKNSGPQYIDTDGLAAVAIPIYFGIIKVIEGVVYVCSAAGAAVLICEVIPEPVAPPSEPRPGPGIPPPNPQPSLPKPGPVVPVFPPIGYRPDPADPSNPEPQIPTPYLPGPDPNRSRGKLDPVHPPDGDYDPGTECSGGDCNPCPPPVIWEAAGNHHGSTSGTHWNGYVYYRNPEKEAPGPNQDCTCYIDRIGWPTKPDLPGQIVIPGIY